MFNKILIANRGEIALRVMQTVQQMGIRAVAIYSDPDRAARHARNADESYPLHGVAAAETYLNIEKIIEIARSCGADAVHPGYGFLSENAAFAQACIDAGLTFIGPSPAAMRAVGEKLIAKKTASAAGVPTVPGWSGDENASSDQWLSEAKKLGYPVLVKAAAGGGGKGMRRVATADELPAAVEQAAREAKSSFGDGRVFLEKYISRPRHVEIQVFADHHGNAVHLFERECSIQRRHQKIIEEAPSPAMTPELRQRMGEASVKLVREIGYTNAGTVEFMLDENGEFYFLEVNARLQVEHPVTELTVLHDLVRAQILVAAGERLPFTQDELFQHGHAIECRIYAEDPASGFLPSTGVIDMYVEPRGASIRVDSGIETGSEVSIHYDPMLAKLIAWGRTRDEAIARMRWALRKYVVLGVTTNIEYLHRILEEPDFVAGHCDTHYLEHHKIEKLPDAGRLKEALIAAAWASTFGASQSESPVARSSVLPSRLSWSPWLSGSWRNGE